MSLYRDVASGWIVVAPTQQTPLPDHPLPAILLGSADPTGTLAGVRAALLPLSIVSRDAARGKLTRWGDATRRNVELWAATFRR
jgi:hypothetical protein